MRPLLVLLLVLASLGVLLFSLSTLGGREPRTTEPPLKGAPLTESPRANGELLKPAEVVSEPTGTATEETREAMQPESDAYGRVVAFGGILGTVVTEDRKPIAGALVSLYNSRPSPLGEEVSVLRGTDPPRPLAKIETDASGAFRFEHLDPRKDWTLSVTHPSYQSWTSDLAIPVPEGGMWPEQVVLTPGLRCTGVVRDAGTQAPIQGATLVAESAFAFSKRKAKSPGRIEAVTDANGIYVFENIGGSISQPRMLTVSAPGYATQVHANYTMFTYGAVERKTKNKQMGGKIEGREQDFEMQPAKVIAGRVIGPDRRGVAGIELEAMSQSGDITCTGLATSGANGEFLLENMAEGLYTLRINAAKYDAHPLQRVEAGDTNVVVELFEQATVTGRVVDSSDHPLSRFVVKVRVTNEVSNAYGSVVGQRNVKDSKDGRFEIAGVPEGSYVIEAAAEGYASSFSDSFVTTQGLVTNDIVVRMSRGGSLSGMVFDAYGNGPIVGAQVTTSENNYDENDLSDLFAVLEPSAMTKAKVFTDTAGRFSVELMTPGEYQVRITAKGFSPQIINDVVIVDGQNTEIEASGLISGAVIKGVVYGHDRLVLPGANISLYPADPADSSAIMNHRVTRSDGTGHYVLENALPGTYELSATRSPSTAGNPFEALSDMQRSRMVITIEDGKQYEIDLHLGPN